MNSSPERSLGFMAARLLEDAVLTAWARGSVPKWCWVEIDAQAGHIRVIAHVADEVPVNVRVRRYCGVLNLLPWAYA